MVHTDINRSCCMTPRCAKLLSTITNQQTIIWIFHWASDACLYMVQYWIKVNIDFPIYVYTESPLLYQGHYTNPDCGFNYNCTDRHVHLTVGLPFGATL